MKRFRVFSLIMTALLLMCLSFTACSNGDTYTYSVWTGTFDFAGSSKSYFGALQDGYYRRQELTKTDFNWYKENAFKNRPENKWTEDQIYSYLLGWGFSNTVAKKETEWLISIDHGHIGTRNGSLLYVLLK